ncbi:hypothetical protein [uncultured Hymenobacter sp.]|uniref:hypothetical protein n=1 Tax=uncultured Hymenobacter sp. TaxID=170016 RepID=UPI0035CAAA5D
MTPNLADAPAVGDSGPAEAPPATRACPHCGHAVPCYRPAESRFFSCPECRHFFRAAPGEPQAYLEASPLTAPGPAPRLALGSVGTLSGYRLRVVGYQRRGEQGDAAQWGEYQLAPADATAEAAAAADPAFPLQLAEYQGHWLLIRPAARGPQRVVGRGVVWNDPADGDRPYRLWHRYETRIVEVRGEFADNVLAAKPHNVVELVSPPYQLVGEVQPGKTYTWYRARYLEPKQVAAAFGLRPDQLPTRTGVGAAQPPPGSLSWGRLTQLAWAGLVLLLVLQALLLLRQAPMLAEQEFTLPDQTAAGDSLAVRYQRAQLGAAADSLRSTQSSAFGGPVTVAEAQRVQLARRQATDSLWARRRQAYAAAINAPPLPITLISRSFQVEGPTALSLHLEAPDLANSWVEVSASLINEQTGRAYEATRALEYYSGTESGERWSEGSKSASVDFNAVPSGRYHVNLYPTTDPLQPYKNTLGLRVTADNGLWSNFWLALLALGLPVLLLSIRRYYFEQERWQNSNYGPQE